jgi:hypothetical protein
MGLKTELVEDEDMGDGKEEPAEAGKKKEKEKEQKKPKKKKEKDEPEDPGDGPDGLQGAQEEPVMAQEALAWGFLWWLQFEKAKAAKKSMQRPGVKA